MAEATGPRLLVVGCGAIGGVVAGHLLEVGHDVSLLTTNPEIARALRERGVRVTGDEPPAPSRASAVFETIPASTERFDYVLLATQPPQVEAAAESALAYLADDGRMVCFQNGLCEERVAKLVGPDRVVGAVVAWGASMVEPGVYDRTSAGGFSIGRLDGSSDARLEELARVLEAVGPVSITTNLLGARWSKLAINCNISTLGTIGGDRLGVLMRQRHVRRLALEVMTEVVAVARAERVKLEKVSGTLDLDWIALTEAERTAAGSTGLLAKHTLLLAVGARYRRLRSSMLAAIERGRPPAVEFLNGEVITRAEKHGLDVPVNRAARDWVWDIAHGKRKASHATLRELYERTR
ncbi:MAG: 2-dehydropantoate 2-reductase [Myxococcales bacterium]|nr:2-dehydropantoate 2-reductase [Myxococcales bacterium]